MSVLALTFFTVVGAVLNAGLINILTDPDVYPYYPTPAFADPALRRLRIDFHDLTEVVTIRLLVMRTRLGGRVIYYPLIALILLLLARAPLFGDWKLSPSLIAVIAACVVITLTAAWYLKRATEEARDRCLSKVLQRAARRLEEGEEHQADVLDRIADYIRKERRGMFSPVLPMMLVFIGSIAVWIAIDFMSQFISI